MTCCNLFLYSSGNFGSLLGSHPCYDTESDLVDHVSDVVSDTHQEFAISTEVDDVGLRAEEVTEWVDDPSNNDCLLYTSPSPRDKRQSRMPSSA